MSRAARNKKPTNLQIVAFRNVVLSYFKAHGRTLPWRRTTNPYRIAVSECMLQQTQVPRVIEKYNAFLKAFPTVQALASAPLSKVLIAWSGLGYNRRARFLHELAKTIVREHRGLFPKTPEALEKLPGIGPYTARAISAFAYNQPVTLIETNIRTVFIHHFFKDAVTVPDTALIPYIEVTLDTAHPREWYSALMDYGTFLKQSGIVVHRKSGAYVKQSRFEGSRRQIRGKIMKLLIAGSLTQGALQKATGASPELFLSVVGDLVREGMISKRGIRYTLAAGS